jgi:hypothetical protein
MSRVLLLISFLLAASGITQAQNFNYSVATDSVAWNPLSTQTILNSNNSAWNFTYRVPIGFTFPFLGRNFDSLSVETNGYIVFDNDHYFALTAFSGVGDHVDTAGNHATIGYELSGTSGNHILKIQYLNCSPNPYGDEIQSWQIWLRENGNVEVRIGPGELRYNGAEIDLEQRYRIGLLNMNMDTEECGIFVGGDPTAPQTQPVNPTYPDVLFMESVPPSGYRYTFSPSN